MKAFEKLTEDIREVVLRAGRALPGAGTALSVDDKAGKANYVTQYDRQTQQFLFAELQKLVPDAVMIGEESFETGKPLPNAADFAHSFIIDPIDGTTNFIRHYQHSAISVAYLENGKTMLGMVYDPSLDELFSAVRGGGAFLNDQPIRTADEPLSHAVVGFGTSPYYPELTAATFRLLTAIFPHIADIRRSGSAALDLAYVAAGRTDAFFELRLSPWDYAAGALLVEEAGGSVETPEGFALPFDRTSPVLACSPAVKAPLKALWPH